MTSSIVALSAVTAIAATLTMGHADPTHAAPARPVSYSTQTMGTWATLQLVTPDSSASADLALMALMALHRADSLMSNWTETSEVARINRTAPSEPVRVHPEVAEVLGAAIEIGQQSDGAFDITVEPLVRLWGFLEGEPRVPRYQDIESTLARIGLDKLDYDGSTRVLTFSDPRLRIDLGGIAKGAGVDRAAAILVEANAGSFLVDLSGNMVARGKAPGRGDWQVGVRDPGDELEYLVRIGLVDQAVATSGDYEQFVVKSGHRYGHILDPRTGWPAQGLVSVTVVCESAMVADAWATALFVLGPDEARELAQSRTDLSCVLVSNGTDGGLELWIEEQLRGRAVPHSDLPARVVLHWY